MKVVVYLVLICNFLYYCYCQHHLQKRIAHGNEAVPHSRPYQVHIVMILKSGDPQICGGALISDKYVISATHCFMNMINITNTIVVLGAHDLREQDKEYQIVKDIKIHENFKFEPKKPYANNDIALLKLSKPVKFSKSIQPVNLPRRSQVNESFIDVEAVESGWGRSENQTVTYILKEGFVKVIADEDVCTLPASLICSNSIDNHASCVGDSGSPLVFENTIIGIISGGYCFLFTYYTRITSFIDWIEKNTDIKILE